MACIDSLLYPYIENIDGRFIPVVRLPIDYKEKVKIFYKENGRDKLEGYAMSLSDQIEIRLNWDEIVGLKNISLLSSGLDLDEKMFRFTEHNVHSFEQATILFTVATAYLSLLVGNDSIKS